MKKTQPYFKFYTTGSNKIICVTSYAGRKIRAVAKCSPNDTFDYTKGCELARLRCLVKLQQRRVDRAFQKVKEADIALKQATQNLTQRGEWFSSANKELIEYKKQLKDFEASL